MEKSYVTLEDGIDFRSISKIMTNSGFKLNHATARNILIHAISSFIREIGSELGIQMSKKDILNLVKNPETHEMLTEILFIIVKDLKEEKKL